MLIRSQDKKRLVEMHGLFITEIHKRIGAKAEHYIVKYEIFNYENNSELKIGEYSTEEKAIKVLDMIQEEYQKPAYQNMIADNETAIYQIKVFQMPDDKEVQPCRK